MVAAKDYLLIDSQRYAYDRDSFRAFSLPLDIPDLKAKRRLAPFVSAELVGFQGGIASTLLDDEGTSVSALLGFESDVDSAGSATSSLRVAHQLQAAYSAAGSGVLMPLAADRGVIYAGEQGADRVFHSPDGTAWTAVSTGSGGTNVTALAAFQTFVWAAFDNRYIYRSANGGVTWAQVQDMTSLPFPDGSQSGGTPHAASCSVLLVDAVSPKAFPENYTLFCVAENYASQGAANAWRSSILCYFDSAATTGSPAAVATFPEPYCKAGVVAGGDVWVGTAETTEPVRGAIYAWSRSTVQTTTLAEPTLVARLDGDYATSAAALGGDTYWGTYKGALYRCDGSTLALFRTFPTTRPIRGLATWRDSLYVAIYNDSASRLEVWRMDADGRWTVPHSAADTLDAAGQLVNFTDALYVATGSGTTGKVYRVSATDRNTAASIDTPDIALGAPTLPKRWRRFAAQHAALGAGQSVALSYSTDGGVTWGGTVTNYDVGATESAMELGDGVLAPLARFRVAYAGGTADAFTVRSAVADALPAPDGREVWTADLRLRPRNNGAWADGTADTTDALRKRAILRDLQGETFQVVSPLHGNAGYPDRAMLASLDPQVPLEWRMVEAHPNGQSDVELIVPVRLVQAAGPVNLLENASFERDAPGAHPTGWGVSGTVTAWETDPLGGAIGARVLAITYDGTAASPSVAQTVAVIPGRYYTLSGYLRRLSVTGASAAVYFRVSEAGTPIPGASTTHLAAGSDAALIRYSATFQVPSTSTGTVAVEVFAEGTPGGGVYADAVMLEAGAPASEFRERGA